MEYLNSIAEAFGMLFKGEFTAGTGMVMGGCVLLFVGLITLITSFGRFRKQRDKMIRQLNEK